MVHTLGEYLEDYEYMRRLTRTAGNVCEDACQTCYRALAKSASRCAAKPSPVASKTRSLGGGREDRECEMVLTHRAELETHTAGVMFHGCTPNTH